MGQRLIKTSRPFGRLWSCGDYSKLAILLGLSFITRIFISMGLHIYAHQVSDDPLYLLANKLRILDALDFHNRAIALVASNQCCGENFFSMFVASSQRDHWATPLAAFYSFFGPQPWLASIFLCLCYAAIGFLAYGLARALDQPPRRARWLALLISIWPPSLIWSVLPLRDGPYMLAVFLFLTCLAWLNSPGRLGTLKTIACALGLVVGSGVAYILKGYMLWVLPFAAFSLLAVMLLRNLAISPKASWLRICAAPILVIVTLAVLNNFMYPATPKANIALGTSQSSTQAPAGSAKPRSEQRPAPGPQTGLKTPAPVEQSFRFQQIWKRFLQKLNHAKEFLEFARYLSLLEQHPEYKSTGIFPGGDKGRFGLSNQSWGDIMTEALKGFWNIFTFPKPWQKWPKQEEWGLLAALVSAFSAFWYVLLPGIWAGILLNVWRCNAASVFLLFWSIILGLAMGWTMINLGTIFRIREVIILPMLAAFHPGVYIWLAAKVGLLSHSNNQ